MSFTYDDNGIRTSKTVNGVTHTYQLNGSQIVAEQWSNKLIVYLYDMDYYYGLKQVGYERIKRLINEYAR